MSPYSPTCVRSAEPLDVSDYCVYSGCRQGRGGRKLAHHLSFPAVGNVHSLVKILSLMRVGIRPSMARRSERSILFRLIACILKYYIDAWLIRAI
jgi:hypothetical protein